MLALSGTEPWFWAILNAQKNVENRNWPTRVRGLIALHAAKKMTASDYIQARKFIEQVHRSKGSTIVVPEPSQLARGAITGVVEIIDCVRYQEKFAALEPWFFGSYGFFLRNPVALPEPIPARGALGFWEVPTEVEAQIREQLCLKK